MMEKVASGGRTVRPILRVVLVATARGRIMYLESGGEGNKSVLGT